MKLFSVVVLIGSVFFSNSNYKLENDQSNRLW